jgi:hypothetical protein
MRAIRRWWERSTWYGSPLAVKLILLWIILALCLGFGTIAALLITGHKME